MNKYIVLAAIFTVFFGGFFALAQSDVAAEEAAGKALWEKLKSQQVACAALSDADFELLGEYFMGTMLGTSHESMNEMMEQMMGREGEEQMHVVMGKRFSGCDTDAAYPQGGLGFMPFMHMGGGWSASSQDGSLNKFSRHMMWGYNDGGMGSFGFGFGWIFMILVWVLIIVGIVALIKWLMSQARQGGGSGDEKSPLEILKERYAKGEMDRREFEEKKKDLMS